MDQTSESSALPETDSTDVEDTGGSALAENTALGAWQFSVLARPAFVRRGDRVLPTAMRLWLHVLMQRTQAALQATLNRPVQLRLASYDARASVTSSGLPVDPGLSRPPFGAVFIHPAFEGECVVILSTPAARAMINPIITDQAGLRGDGELSDTESGLIEYVVLSCADTILRDLPEKGHGFTFQRFCGHQECVRLGQSKRDLAVDFELTIAGFQGRIRLICDAWAADGAAISLPRMPGYADGQNLAVDDLAAESVELRLALGAIRLSQAEFQALRPKDILPLGRTTLQSFASPCSVVTTTGWRLGSAEVLADLPTLVSVCCGQLRPTLNSALAEAAQADAVLLVPMVGRITLTVEQLRHWRAGDTLDFPKDPGNPVEIHRGLKCFGKGELVVVDGELGIRMAEKN
ncbi:MAG: FliM/FliN family flagellar motor switch protein [Phycisphaerae bacterium]|nr:FliM/FliN family flagellar motor switch protein [Phycisphaerae bacterium]